MQKGQSDPFSFDVIVEYTRQLTETAYQLPLILFVHLYLCQTICWLMTCDNISSFSALHVAVKGGYEQVVNNIVQLVQQLPPSKEPFLDIRNTYGSVR